MYSKIHIYTDFLNETGVFRRVLGMFLLGYPYLGIFLDNSKVVEPPNLEEYARQIGGLDSSRIENKHHKQKIKPPPDATFK